MDPRNDSLDPSSPASEWIENHFPSVMAKSFKPVAGSMPPPSQYPAVPVSPIGDPYQHAPQGYHAGTVMDRLPHTRAVMGNSSGGEFAAIPALTHGTSPQRAVTQSSPAGFKQPGHHFRENVAFNSDPDIHFTRPVSSPVHVRNMSGLARKINSNVQRPASAKPQLQVHQDDNADEGDMLTVPIHRAAITALSKAPPAYTSWELPIYMTPQEMLTFFPQEISTFWAASRLCQYQWSVDDVADFIAASRGVPDKKGLQDMIKDCFDREFLNFSGGREITYINVLTRRMPLPPALIRGPDLEHRANPRLWELAVGVRVWPTGNGAKLLTKLVRHAVKHELGCRVSELKTMAKALGWFDREVEKEWQKPGSGMIGWMKFECSE